MELAKPGLIKLHCLPNALTTLKEYLVDYADPQTRRLGEGLIARQLALIPSAVRRRQTEEFLGRIERGERDLYV
jgi:2-iminoacetate synthase